MKENRLEKDSMGEMQVPSSALYGASTMRAVLNFPISNHKMPLSFIHSLGYLKYCCAFANNKLGKLSNEKTKLITQISKEIFNKKLDEHFVVDVFQTGSGTSTNMNINEVIANRASLVCNQDIGSKKPIHPNDDVNMGQSSNDTIPSALHISISLALQNKLLKSLKKLEDSLNEKSKEFKDIIKIGRTHLMDATPLTFGQVFSSYSRQINKSISRVNYAIDIMHELAIGGTAVGTGINTDKKFAGLVVDKLNDLTGMNFIEAENHFEAQAARDDAVEVAGILSTICASLTKIANDIRFLSSGPRCGLGELEIPATQPGSSIMPGKVNPVMSEMLIQVCIYVQGLCQSVVIAGRDGYFELNTTIPLIAFSLLDSINCLSNAISTFSDSCVKGIKVNKKRTKLLVDQSLMLVTSLNEIIGYDNASLVAKTAFMEEKTLKQVLLEKNLMTEEQIDKALDPKSMIN